MNAGHATTAVAAMIPAVICGAIFVALQSAGAHPLMIGLFKWTALFSLALAVWRLIRDIRFWFVLRRLLRPVGIYGRIGGINTLDTNSMGLSHFNLTGDGIPIGSDDGKHIAYWDGKGHMSVRAPTEAGKTASLFLGATLSLGQHRSLVTTGKGAEVAVKSYRFRNTILGQNVYNIDPWGEAKKYGLPIHRFNPMGHLVKLAEFRSHELGEYTRYFAFAMKPEDENASGENKLFRSVARDMLAEVARFRAICEADDGELICNPVGLYRDFCRGTPNLMAVFQEMQACPDYDGAVSAAGYRFASMFQETPKTAQNFLTEITDALAIYEPSGVLAQSVEWSDFDPADLKSPDGVGTTVNLITPPGKAETYGRHFGLVLDALAISALEENRFFPRCTLLLDEFEQLFDGKWNTAERILKTGRSAGVNMVSAVQEVAGYAAYGDKATMWETQPEIVMAWGVRDPDDAEHYAKRAGKQSIVGVSGGAKDAEDGISLNLKEEGIDLFRADQFLHMEPFTAAVFYKQHPPRIVDLVHVKSVRGWAENIVDLPDAQPEPEFDLRFNADDHPPEPFKSRLAVALHDAWRKLITD